MVQIFVKTLLGNTLAVDVNPELDTVAAVARQVEEREGVPCEEQRLLIGGRQMESDRTLESYGVEKASEIQLVLSLLGGGKKRKKKNYTKPKKTKHKHKSVKLAALKFYQVDENNKITRLRKECPSENCAGGIFMAQHKDRFYCGKCSLTFLNNDAKAEA